MTVWLPSWRSEILRHFPHSNFESQKNDVTCLPATTLAIPEICNRGFMFLDFRQKYSGVTLSSFHNFISQFFKLVIVMKNQDALRERPGSFFVRSN